MTPEKCFWARRVPEGEVLVFSGYEPCEEMVQLWATGVVVFEIQDEPVFENQPPMMLATGPTYPTGRWLVMSRDAEVLKAPVMAEVMAIGRMFAAPDLYEMILGASDDSEASS